MNKKLFAPPAQCLHQNLTDEQRIMADTFTKDIMQAIEQETHRKLVEIGTHREDADFREKVTKNINDFLSKIENNVPKYRVDDPYMIDSFALKDTRRGPVAIFSDPDGNEVEEKQYRSRRTAKKKAKARIGEIVADFWLTPIHPAILYTATITEKPNVNS